VLIRAGKWLFLRRHAAHRVATIRQCDQRQPVVGSAPDICPVGKNTIEQRGVEQVAAESSGRRAAVRIGTAEAGCEADDQVAGLVGNRRTRTGRIDQFRFARARGPPEAGEAVVEERANYVGFVAGRGEAPGKCGKRPRAGSIFNRRNRSSIALSAPDGGVRALQRIAARDDAASRGGGRSDGSRPSWIAGSTRYG